MRATRRQGCAEGCAEGQGRDGQIRTDLEGHRASLLAASENGGRSSEPKRAQHRGAAAEGTRWIAGGGIRGLKTIHAQTDGCTHAHSNVR